MRMPLPVFINNRDLLHTTKAQVEFFSRHPDVQVVIVDNDSTYPPLLEWYAGFTKIADTLHGPKRQQVLTAGVFHRENVMLIRLPANFGPRAVSSVLPCFAPSTNEYSHYSHYFWSDSDIDYSPIGSPSFLNVFAERSREHYLTSREDFGVGVGLRVSDLPASKNGEYARDTELRRPLYRSHWIESITDTAGVLRPFDPPWCGGYYGNRSEGYVARHLPWYFVPDDWTCPACSGPAHSQPLARYLGEKGFCLSCYTAMLIPDDFRYFYAHANPSGTCYTAWQLDDTRAK